jgi:hypothetical protein
VHPEPRTPDQPPRTDREAPKADDPAPDDALARDDLPEDERIEQQNDLA